MSVIRLLCLCLLIAITPAAYADSFIVNVGGSTLSFSPQTITINAGDTVTFINKGGFHNVVADDGSFRCARGCDGDGKGGNGGASNSNWLVSVTFNNPGAIGYFCEVHGMPGAGMFGTVNVNGVVPPPPPSTDGVPGGSPSLYLLLALALVLATVSRLRRVKPATVGDGSDAQAPRKPR